MSKFNELVENITTDLATDDNSATDTDLKESYGDRDVTLTLSSGKYGDENFTHYDSPEEAVEAARRIISQTNDNVERTFTITWSN